MPIQKKIRFTDAKKNIFQKKIAPVLKNGL